MSMYANRDGMIAALKSDLTAERAAHDATKGEVARLKAGIERMARDLALPVTMSLFQNERGMLGFVLDERQQTEQRLRGLMGGCEGDGNARD